MSQAQLISEQRVARFRAAAFAWIGWLLRIILLMGAPSRSRRLQSWRARLERSVEYIVFLMAVRRFGYLPQRRHRPRAAAPRGFRRVRGSQRLFYKSARIRAKARDLRIRAMRLLDVLADPEIYIARFFKRIYRGLRFTRLVPTAPPTSACASLASPEAVFLDDP